MQKNVIKEENSDEISLSELIQKIKDWYNYLKTQWKQILLVGFIGGGIGFLIAFFTPTTYTAKVSFVLEEGKAGGSGLSALAGEFGLDMSSNSNSNMLAGDNIIRLLGSRRMVKISLLSPYDSVKKITLADKYATVYGLKKKWEKSLKHTVNFDAYKITQNKLELDSLLHIIEDRILKEELKVERRDKRMSFIDVSVSMRDELLNKFFSENLIRETADFYIETKTRRKRDNVTRLQKRADSIAGILNRQTYTAATSQSQSLDINPAFQIEAVGNEINIRNKGLLMAIYGEVVKNLEIQKATLTQETPVMQQIDVPEMPLIKNKASKLFSILQFGFIAILLSSIFFIIKNQGKK